MFQSRSCRGIAARMILGAQLIAVCPCIARDATSRESNEPAAIVPLDELASVEVTGAVAATKAELGGSRAPENPTSTQPRRTAEADSIESALRRAELEIAAAEPPAEKRGWGKIAWLGGALGAGAVALLFGGGATAPGNPPPAASLPDPPAPPTAR